MSTLFLSEVGASDQPCSETYAGSEAFSEPETAAVADFLLTHQGEFDAFVTIHSYGQYWLTPWGYTSQLPDDYEDLVRPWWRHDMKTLSTLLALCAGNPPVPSQRASNWELWCFLLSLTWASCWTYSRVNCQWFEMPWRWCNDTVISPLKFGIKSHNFSFVGLFKHYPWIGLHVVVDVSSGDVKLN